MTTTPVNMCTRNSAVLLALFTIAQCHLPTDNEFWAKLAKEELAEALKVQWNLRVARNVILFIGDGMGPYTVTATRIYKGGESHRLVYEKFPHVGMLKTYNANFMVPDSASTATAMLCGTKVNQNTMGVDASVQEKDCAKSLEPEVRLKSLVQLAQEAGKSTGLVTTMRVTHATPGPMYAHSADRRWECEANMPDTAAACKDIARQLVEDEPGKSLNVIMGGGRQCLVSNQTSSSADPLDTWSCISHDGRNLIEDYKTDKQNRGLKYSVVQNNEELKNLDVTETDYVLGIFANGHLKYEHERDKGPKGMPSISDMTEAAIKILRKNEKGFFLMVEGGNIDMAHHRGKAKKAINESAAMEEAVALATTLVDEEDTLLIVTSDHTHGLIINGFPERGSNIFGIIKQAASKGVNYTTLAYGTGGPGSNQHYVTYDSSNQPTVSRRDPSLDDTDDFEYEQIAAAESIEGYHGGGDVLIFARGPQSHLFHNIHEQHYVYHVINYAAKMGEHSAASEFAASGAVILFGLLLSSAILTFKL